MGLALELATETAKTAEIPVGAVLIHDGRVIGRGQNSPISSKDPTAHAEINAIRDAAQRLSNYRLVGTTLYVTLEPCTMCAGAMTHSRIDRLVFGAYDSKRRTVGSLSDLHGNMNSDHRFEVLGGIRDTECRALLKRFFFERR